MLNMTLPRLLAQAGLHVRMVAGRCLIPHNEQEAAIATLSQAYGEPLVTADAKLLWPTLCRMQMTIDSHE